MDDDNLFKILGVEEPQPDADAPADMVTKQRGPDTATPTTPSLGARLRSHLHTRFPLTDLRKKLAPDATFKIDDRGGQGDKVTLTWSVRATVPDSDDGRVLLVLENTPHDGETDELVTKAGGSMGRRIGNTEHHLPVRPSSKDIALLRRIAMTVRQVVGQGRTYDDPNWKWLANRIAEALEALATHLSEFDPLAPPSTGSPSTPKPKTKPSPTPPPIPKPTPPAAKKKPPQ